MAPTASRYNLIENGDFRHGTQGWSLDSLTGTDGTVTSADPTPATELENTVAQLTGNPETVKHIYQRVLVSGAAGDTFILSGWAKGDSVPLLENTDRDIGLYLCFNYADGSYHTENFHFNPDTDSENSWQYGSWAAVAKKAYTSINIDIRYDYNMNTACFDGIQLFKEEFGSSYTYDDEGNVTSVTDLQKKQTTYEYSANNLTKEILPSGVTLDYTYDSWHNVKTATTEEGLVYTFTYDAYGNNTAVSITAAGQTMTSTAAYSTDGNRLVTTTDTLGKTTTYSYNENTNVLEWVKYPEDTDATRTNYSYDEMYRLSGVSTTLDTGKTLWASYGYEDDKLYEINKGGTTVYLGYGAFDQLTWIGPGSYNLASYTYTDDQNRYLKRLDYDNGGSVEYTYDDKGRVTSQTYELGRTISYAYDNNGALATVYDSSTGRTTKYYYDFIGRTVKQVETGTNYSHSVSYGYDEINNLTSMVETLNGVVNTTNYAYDDDNRLTSVIHEDFTREYSYDDFGRVTGEVTKDYEGTTVVTQTPTYYAPSATTTSGQVTSYQVTSNGYNKTFSYTYDDNGNILSISDGTNTTSYVYDSANQLIRENNQAANKTWTWEYDNAGNILNKKEYTYTTGTLGTPKDTIVYTYGEGEWGDLLTAYDGESFSYENFETTSLYSSLFYDDKYEYDWVHGHQLSYLYEFFTEYYFCEYYFAYDASGMRTKLVKETTDWECDQYWKDTYEYTYNGTQLTRMTYDGAAGWWTMDFRYDADGTPVSVTFEHVAHEPDMVNGGYLDESTAYDCCIGTYYYITNLQGDVIALVDENGDLAGTYTYDAWGNIVARNSQECIASANPLRYRGYVYDTQTGFYYLQSRYYDPEKGRFISPDAFVSTGQGVLGNNMFAYCGNNPVSRVDETGALWDTIFDVVSLGFSIAEAIKNPDDPMAWLGVVADVASLVIPCVSGGGALVRAVTKVDDVVDIAKTMDNIDDVADVAKMATTGSPSTVGKIGEKLAGIDPHAKISIQVNGRTRIPDALSATTLTEVKNVSYISNTRQLKDFADFANATGRTMELYVRPTTRIAQTVIDAGWKINYLW